MADVIVLMMEQPYAIVGQSHPGWLGFVQKRVLGTLGCLWFNRTDQSDRTRVSAAYVLCCTNPCVLILLQYQSTYSGCRETPVADLPGGHLRE